MLTPEKREAFNAYLSAETGVANAIEHYCIGEDKQPIDPRKTPKEWAHMPIVQAAKRFVKLHGWEN